ncbi:MAG: septum formation initiator family protein [Mariprofundus sp.]|nr:septum formation initiator family protein [Mariprofundus sp.]
MSGRIGRWLLWIGGGATIVYMSWNLVFSDHGYLVYRHEAEQLQQLKSDVATLKAEREQLAKEVLRLRNDPDALEELVHRELGYVHPDEYMVIMPGDRKQEKKP